MICQLCGEDGITINHIGEESECHICGPVPWVLGRSQYEIERDLLECDDYSDDYSDECCDRMLREIEEEQ